jgi:hypothetical protein
MTIRTFLSFRKAMSLALVALVIMTTGTVGRAQARAQDGAPAAEKIRAKVAKLGTGKRSRAEVTLKDDRKLKGYIGEISENGFTLVDPNRGTVTPIAYDEVRQVKSRNNAAREIAFFGATMAGVLILVLATVSRSR